MAETIAREELQQKIERGDDFVLVETLPHPFYRHTHLPGAVNLPLAEVMQRAVETLPNKQAQIVVYCAGPT